MLKDKHNVRTGLWMGLLCVAFTSLFKIYLSILGQNPYFDKPFVQFFIMPILMILGGVYYKVSYRNQPFGFTYALRFFLAMLVSFVLVQLAFDFIFMFSNESFLAGYIEKSVAILKESKEETVKLFGEKSYSDTLQQLTLTSNSDVVLSEFIKKLGFGLVISFILAILLRK